jgi:hypothetical protein
MKLHYSPGIPIRLNIKKPNKNEAYLLLKKEIILKIIIIISLIKAI